MKKLALVCVILVSMVSITMGKMSKEEWNRAKEKCGKRDKSACEAIINSGFLPSVERCSKYGGKDLSDDNCIISGIYYDIAGRYREAIPYYEKAIALGDNDAYVFLGILYGVFLQDYPNAKKYYEMGCNKGNGDFAQASSCTGLGEMYYNGQGVRQDYHKTFELYKKACDMKYGIACNNLGLLYAEGQGVRQNESIAKQYFGKACDLGEQMGCDNYRKANEIGIR